MVVQQFPSSAVYPHWRSDRSCYSSCNAALMHYLPSGYGPLGCSSCPWPLAHSCLAPVTSRLSRGPGRDNNARFLDVQPGCSRSFKKICWCRAVINRCSGVVAELIDLVVKRFDVNRSCNSAKHLLPSRSQGVNPLAGDVFYEGACAGRSGMLVNDAFRLHPRVFWRTQSSRMLLRDGV